MDERLIRLWIRECLLTGEAPSLLNEETLQVDHFPGADPASSNKVIATALANEESKVGPSFDSFTVRTDKAYLYVDDPKDPDKKKAIRQTKGAPVTLKARHYNDIKKPKGVSSGKHYVEVDVAGTVGWMLVTNLDHSISSKDSQKITADGKIGKTAEYALEQASKGNKYSWSDALKRSGLRGIYDTASVGDKKNFRSMYKALFVAARGAIASLASQGITLSAGSVPKDPNAIVDVSATIAQGGGARKAEIHVKYNDSNRKFGLQPGVRLKDTVTKKQYMVKNEEGDLIVRTETRSDKESEWAKEGEDVLLGDTGANNPSTLIWKHVREQMHQDWIPDSIRDDVVAGRYKPPGGGDVVKDTEFLQRDTMHPETAAMTPKKTGSPRVAYHKALETAGYPAQLAADVAKNFKNVAAGAGTEEKPSVLTMYALFTANSSGVNVEIQAYDLTTDTTTGESYGDTGNLVAQKIVGGDSKLMMYNITRGPGDKAPVLFRIEFRSAGASTGHPPQVKSGPKKDKLEPSMSSSPPKVEQVASAAGSATVEKEPEGKAQNAGYSRRGTLMQENIVSGQNEKLIRTLVREMLLTEAFTKTDEDKIGVLSRKEIDKVWKKDREKKVQAMIDKSTKNAYRNDDFYKVVGKIWKELMKVYAEEQFQHARRFTRYDVPLARIRP